MIRLRKGITIITRKLIKSSQCQFSDKWKDKDNAEQKVYITKKQAQAMKLMVKKFELEQADQQSNYEQFTRKLRQSMKRNKIQNQSLQAQIVNLHKTLTGG